MGLKAFRLQNFMAYQDSGWIDIKPIVLLFGVNSAGKSIIFRALRLLKQSLSETKKGSPFNFSIKDGVNLGTFDVISHGQGKKAYYRPFEKLNENTKPLTVSFGFRCNIDDVNIIGGFNNIDNAIDNEATVDLYLKYVWDEYNETALLDEVSFEFPSYREDEKSSVIFRAFRIGYVKQDDWWFDSDLFLRHTNLTTMNIWHYVTPEITNSFFPSFFKPPILPESEVEKDFSLVQKLLQFFREDISRFLTHMYFIPPLRRMPQREYLLDDTERMNMERQGLGSFLRYLSGELIEPKSAAPDKVQMIDRWLKELELGDRVVARKIHNRQDHSPLVEIVIDELGDGIPEVNIIDMGFGVSQVLPIIISGVLAESGDTVVIEQPELHLHPRLQIRLGNFFAEQSSRGVRFLLETHSEHLLLRFQLLISETRVYQETLAKTKGQKGRHNAETDSLPSVVFHDSDINTFFTYRIAPSTFLLQLSFGVNGFIQMLENPLVSTSSYKEAKKSYNQFFGDDTLESMKISGLIMQLDQDRRD